MNIKRIARYVLIVAAVLVLLAVATVAVAFYTLCTGHPHGMC